MCVSKEVSLAAFIFAVLASLFLCWYFEWERRVVLFVLFYLFLSLMQLSEYFIWSNQDLSDPKQAKANSNASQSSAMFLGFQPVVMYAVMMLMATTSDTYKGLATVLIVLYTLYFVNYLNKVRPETMYVVPCGKGGTCDKNIPVCLRYSWGSNILYSIYLVCVFVVPFFLLPFKMALAWFLIFAGFLFLSMIISKTIGCGWSAPSFWCLLSICVPVIFFFLWKWYLKNETEI